MQEGAKLLAVVTLLVHYVGLEVRKNIGKLLSGNHAIHLVVGVA